MRRLEKDVVKLEGISVQAGVNGVEAYSPDDMMNRDSENE